MPTNTILSRVQDTFLSNFLNQPSISNESQSMISNPGFDTEDSDLFTDIEYAEQTEDNQKLIELFNSISTEDLNKNTETYPYSTLLHALIKNFDKKDKRPEYLDNLFQLENVDPQHVNVNYRNQMTGSTALMLAASRGQLRLVQTLIHWKADPYARSANQMTAFFCACSRGNVEVAEFLSTYVTREELQLKQTITGKTPKTELEEQLLESPNKEKFLHLLKMINDIEIRHLVQDRVEAEAAADLMNTEE